MEGAEALLPLEEFLVADSEQRASQRREHRQLIVRPLDRRQRGAERFDFLAIVKCPAADEDVMHAARFESADVGLRHVLAEAEEAPEQNADVARLDGAAAVHLPAAVVDQPLDVAAHGVGQRLLDAESRHVAGSIRLGNGQHDNGWLPLDRGAMRRQRDVIRLQRGAVAVHDRRERGVDDRLDPGHAAKTRGQCDAARTGGNEPLAHLAVNRDVRATEAVNRLLGIADDEEPARHRRDGPPVRGIRIGRREEEQDFGLERIGVLELVHEDARKAPLEAGANGRIAADQVPRLQQQVEEIERARSRLQVFVCHDGAGQLRLQKRGEMRIGVEAELIQPRAQRLVGIHDALTGHAGLVAGSATVADPRKRAIA